MTTLVAPVLKARGLSDGTGRVPRKVSPASSTASVDSQIFVLLVPGNAGPPERFLVVSVTEIVAPAPEDAGAVRAETVRSGLLLKAALQALGHSETYRLFAGSLVADSSALAGLNWRPAMSTRDALAVLMQGPKDWNAA